MDLTVLIMVLSIYVGAVAAPVSLFILARRTGHGRMWRSVVAVCALLVWVAVIMGFLSEFLDAAIPRDLLEMAGFFAVISFAVLALMGLVMVMRPWPATSPAPQPRYSARPFSSMVTDIE